MISPLLINEPPLQILPTLAKIVGLNEAIVLQQVHYWLNPDFNNNFFEGKHWVHNTFNQWQKQFFFWSRKTIKRTIANLEDSGLLISFITGGFKKTKYYTLDYDLLGRISLPGVHAYSARTRTGNTPRYEIDGNNLKPLENDSENQDVQPFQQKLLMDWSDCVEGQLSPDQDEIADLANFEETIEKQRFHSWGQNNPLDGVNLTSSMLQKKSLKLQGTEEMAEKQGPHPWGQCGPLDRVNVALSTGSKWPPRWGQSDPLDGVNLTPSLYTENTSENTNTTPLSPPSCPSSARSDLLKLDPRSRPGSDESQEENEEENKKIENPEEQPCQETIPLELIPQRMVDFWNQSVQSKIYPGQEVRLTEKRKELLDAFLETVLDNKLPPEKYRDTKHRDTRLDGWRHYCSLIAQSKFLAGNNSSGFRVTLDWALVPNNAWKILEGAIYDKPEPVSRHKDLPWEAFSEELARTLPTGKHLAPWFKISVALAKVIGQAKYRSWFGKVSLEELTETKAIFSVEGNFTKAYISTHFSRDIQGAIQTLYPNVTQIDFQLPLSDGGNFPIRREGLVPAKAENNQAIGENE